MAADDIDDGSLRAYDIGRYEIAFAVNVGVVNATSCVNKNLALVDSARVGHVLLTPDVDTAHGGLVYDVRYSAFRENATLHVCNFGNTAVDDGHTFMNAIWFDARP